MIRLLLTMSFILLCLTCHSPVLWKSRPGRLYLSITASPKIHLYSVLIGAARRRASAIRRACDLRCVPVAKIGGANRKSPAWRAATPLSLTVSCGFVADAWSTMWPSQLDCLLALVGDGWRAGLVRENHLAVQSIKQGSRTPTC